MQDLAKPLGENNRKDFESIHSESLELKSLILSLQGLRDIKLIWTLGKPVNLFELSSFLIVCVGLSNVDWGTIDISMSRKYLSLLSKPIMAFPPSYASALRRAHMNPSAHWKNVHRKSQYCTLLLCLPSPHSPVASTFGGHWKVFYTCTQAEFFNMKRNTIWAGA